MAMTGHVAQNAREEWRHNWPILVPCFLGAILCSLHVASMGVMILAVEADYGWPRAEISGGMTVIAVMTLFTAPFSGLLVDRIGSRPIALAGVFIYGAALAGLGLAQPQVWTWLALWFVLGISTIFVMPVVWLAILNQWFVHSRGLAMAIVLSGTGVANAIVPFVTERLISYSSWQFAYLALATIGIAICAPVSFLFLKPGPAAARPVPAAQRKMLRLAWPKVSGKFVRLAGAAFFFSLGSAGLTTNVVPLMVADGLTREGAAATVALVGIGSIVGRIVGGYLLDRLNGNMVAAASAILPIAAALIFIFVAGDPLGSAIACLVMGLAAGAEVDCCAYLVSRHFGTGNFGALFGTLNGLLLFGVGLAPLLANQGYDMFGSYHPGLIASIPIWLLAGILFATLGAYPPLAHQSGEAGQPSPN